VRLSDLSSVFIRMRLNYLNVTLIATLFALCNAIELYLLAYDRFGGKMAFVDVSEGNYVKVLCEFKSDKGALKVRNVRTGENIQGTTFATNFTSVPFNITRGDIYECVVGTESKRISTGYVIGNSYTMQCNSSKFIVRQICTAKTCPVRVTTILTHTSGVL